ncbi:GGDEF domain-containing protein [Alkaliphilus serpentinus]|uniref:GGDEF domain-containing protein n=1 Tax=Alkaliphilus serpentinus TaxID=1482731 RepID=A0A833HQ49_9FIRM|nr:GGDEF domain-containing protein [Alkaliphilus serpentinus]KAB3530517.1 GGDEF domain-containing protein [Alkaliphilus serpentinus]
MLKSKFRKLRILIKNKTIQVSILLSVIIIGLLVGIASHRIKESLTSQMLKENYKIVKQVNNGIHLFYSFDKEKTIKNIKSIGQWVLYNIDEMDNEKLYLLADTFNVAEINIIDESGVITSSSDFTKVGEALSHNSIHKLANSLDSLIIENTEKEEGTGRYIKRGYIKNFTGGYIQVSVERNFSELHLYSYQMILDELVKDGKVIYGLFVNTDLVATAHSNIDHIGEEIDNKGSRLAAIDGMTYATEYYNEDKDYFTYEIFFPVRIDEELIGAIILGASMKRVYNLIFGHILTIIIVGVIILALIIILIVKLSNYKEYAIKDTLTGAYSRLFLEKWLSTSEKENRKEENTLVVMIDIDNFKVINDTYGHSAGDLALIELTNLLKASLRKGDFVVRYGGDEFILILKNCKKDVAEKIMERIEERVALINIKGQDMEIGLSYGIEELKRKKDFVEYFNAVDERMYYSKNDKK